LAPRSAWQQSSLGDLAALLSTYVVEKGKPFLVVVD
jgi:hypothetical protein